MIGFHLLGSVDLKGSEGEVLRSVLTQPKRVALLAYLAVAQPNGYHRRDKLLGLFWPESDQERGRAALRKAIYRLRQSLGEEVIVSRGDEEIGLADGAVWCDAVAFEESLQRGEPEEALELYRGDLLEGFFLSDAPEFERWLEGERGRLRARAAEAAWSVAERAERAGNGIEAAAWARRATALLPDDEGALRRVIELLERVGDRAGAMKEYDVFAQRLREQYAVEPSQETQALVAGIRQLWPTERDETGGAGGFADTRAAATGIDRPERSKSRWPLWATAAAVFAVATGLAWYVGRGRVASEAGPTAAETGVVERRAIAVLPFDNLSGDPEDEYFSAGIHDEIITKLAGIGALRVISRGSVMEFKGRTASPRVVAERLGVDFVLEGGVRRSGNRVRITAQLIDAQTDDLLWAQTYDRGLSDIFAVQSDVANQIARALSATLTPVERARIAHRPTESIEAHNAYLLGRFHWNKRTAESLRTAIDFFQRAIELDPQYALAHSGLADSYILLETYGRNRQGDMIPAARAAALRALEIDSLVGEAHSSLAWIKLEFDWDFVGAGSGFERAIELNPSYATAHHWYAVYLFAMGRLDESLTHFRKAEELDPLSVIITAEVGIPLAGKGDYSQAIEQYRKALALDPDFALAHSWLGLTYAYQGMFDQAIDECQRAVDLSGRLRLYVENLAYAYAAAGQSAAARSLLQELDEEAHDLPVEVYAKLGELDLAFQILESEYHKHRFPVLSAKSDPRFAEMRADPRFSALLKKVGLE